MATLSKQECRDRAMRLLSTASGYQANTPGRLDRLAEAQVYATLALSAPEQPVAPAPEDGPKRSRTRKSTPAKPDDEVVPGSEEDLIRREREAE